MRRFSGFSMLSVASLSFSSGVTMRPELFGYFLRQLRNECRLAPRLGGRSVELHEDDFPSRSPHASSYFAHLSANPRPIFPAVGLPVHVNAACFDFFRGKPSCRKCLCQCSWLSRRALSTSAGTTKMRQASSISRSLNHQLAMLLQFAASCSAPRSDSA